MYIFLLCIWTTPSKQKDILRPSSVHNLILNKLLHYEIIDNTDKHRLSLDNNREMRYLKYLKYISRFNSCYLKLVHERFRSKFRVRFEFFVFELYKISDITYPNSAEKLRSKFQ